jgi:hypothetical protein
MLTSKEGLVVVPTKETGMRLFTAGLLMAGLIICSAPAHPDEPAGEIDALIVKLGSTKYAERESAMRALDQHGAAALKALEAATLSADPEIRHRAGLLLQRIENRLTVALLLSGKKIRLVYKDVNVLDAVNDLSAKAGFQIDVEGDRLGVRERKITLDTGETTFWEAFDLFCKGAGLSERLLWANNTALLKQGVDEFRYPGYGPGENAHKRIALIDNKAAALPTSYVGALRLRAVQQPVPTNKSAYPVVAPHTVGFHLELTPEPKLPWRGAVWLRISKAIDDQGQHLVQPEPFFVQRFADPYIGADEMRIWDSATALPVTSGNASRILPVRLVPGKKVAKSLKEIHGTVAVELIAPQRLATINNIMAAQGKTFATTDGSELKVTAVTPSKSHYFITVQVSHSASAADAGQGVRVVKMKKGVVIIEGSNQPNLGGTFTLQDAKGEPIALVLSEHAVVENGKGGLGVEHVLKFQTKAQQLPAQLTYTGLKATTVAIPFTLRDVPLVDDPQALPAQAPMTLYTR